eukprot:8838559-Pyramimonas_sp.AAC.1
MGTELGTLARSIAVLSTRGHRCRSHEEPIGMTAMQPCTAPSGRTGTPAARRNELPIGGVRK